MNLRSYLLLKKIVKKRQSKIGSPPDSTVASNASTVKSKSRKERFGDWMSPKPKPIKLFPGETEIFRKGLVLVTDTRFAYIDPFDRMLKTYMFEHMISIHKQFYRTSDLNRRLCKGLLVFSLLALLVILTIDFLDSDSGIFFLVYIPLIASIGIGIKVWNDMKPQFIIHWRMRDLTYGEIVQEPWFRERLVGSQKREDFMNDLADAMNEALSTKAWVPDAQIGGRQAEQLKLDIEANEDATDHQDDKKPVLQLVTEKYL